ncbi:hypothetical protein LPU83_pLPU83b_0208 (plasmid) [Rhizobium favelukesii]|uniref:Uncharacterized protein n=1 Tax=Rhizobium favelukesii TaxID=348824 RepID=W6RG50_9HYPH|nr:hypothetical protein LPU83_pLPU83b_0208 [Rhizobium favelukesii]
MGALYWGAVGEGRIWSAHLVQVFDSTRGARPRLRPRRRLHLASIRPHGPKATALLSMSF